MPTSNDHAKPTLSTDKLIASLLPSEVKIVKIKGLMTGYRNKLDTIKDNLSRSGEEGWTDSEIREADALVKTFALILSDLNKVLNDNA